MPNDPWYPVTEPGETLAVSAATVVYTPESTDILVAVVSPTGTVPFCLSTSTRSTESQSVSSWQLCVTIVGYHYGSGGDASRTRDRGTRAVAIEPEGEAGDGVVSARPIAVLAR